MKCKFELDAEEVKKEIKKQLEKEKLEVLLDGTDGTVEIECPSCGATKLEVLGEGKVRCLSCKQVFSLDVRINWD